MNSLIFGVLVVLYYFIHSLLANDNIKSRLYKVIPSHYYRLLYTIISVIGLLYLLKYYNGLDQNMIFENTPFIYYSGLAILISGVLLINVSLLSFDLFEFIGFKQITKRSPKLEDKMNTTGLYRLVRHPLYLGFILLFSGLFLFRPDVNILIVSSVSIAYTFIGGYLEEKRLAVQFGSAYKEYQKTTPFIFPVSKKD